eukprot:4797583-Pleurochrysis_carterae.AAC.1
MEPLEPFNSTTRAAAFLSFREAVGTYRITMATKIKSNAYSVLVQPLDDGNDAFVTSKTSIVSGDEFVIK